ncbi:hypothetical protein JYU19_00005, partial [bacterium AH-315-J21]|nr:hypothetical protein [bacterium AH-315-J21]
MNLMNYLSRNYFGPMYNSWKGFGEINGQIAHWQGVMSLSPAEIQGLERKRLANILHSAYQNTRYYRELFDSNGLADRLDSPDILAEIPLLDKDIIRANTADMLNSSLPEGEILKTMTGGSTSDPMVFYRDRSTYCARWGLQAVANMALGWESGEW